MKFNEFVYKRIDPEEMKGKIRKITEDLKNAPDAEAQLIVGKRTVHIRLSCVHTVYD